MVGLDKEEDKHMEVLGMTEKERKDVKMSTLYELRLLLDSEDKETYTKEELLKFLDTIARTKDTE